MYAITRVSVSNATIKRAIDRIMDSIDLDGENLLDLSDVIFLFCASCPTLVIDRLASKLFNKRVEYTKNCLLEKNYDIMKVTDILEEKFGEKSQVKFFSQANVLIEEVNRQLGKINPPKNDFIQESMMNVSRGEGRKKITQKEVWDKIFAAIKLDGSNRNDVLSGTLSFVTDKELAKIMVADALLEKRVLHVMKWLDKNGHNKETAITALMPELTMPGVEMIALNVESAVDEALRRLDSGTSEI